MDINMPWISVVIPTYGKKGAQLSQKCVSSIRKHHSQLENLEIILVNDGKEGLAELSRVADKHKCRVIEIERGGFAKACNAGIVESSGLVIVLCNNDIEFFEPTLQIMADAAGVFGGLVGTRLLYPNRKIQHGGVCFVPTANQTIPGYFDHVCRMEHENHVGAVCIRQGQLMTGALLAMTQTVIQVVGLLDERFGFTCEDIDMCLRCMESGITCTYLGYTAAIHHEGASRGRTLEEKMRLFPDIAEKESKALKFFFDKYAGVDMSGFTLGAMNGD